MPGSEIIRVSRREDIPNTFWDDHDDLSTDALLLLIWSTTQPRCPMAGAYRCPRRHLAEGRIPDDRLDDALLELRQKGLLFYEQKIVWNPERVERLHTRTAQIAKSIAKDLLEQRCP